MPVAETDKLAALLRAAGVDVSIVWQQAGHQLVHDDIVKAREWLANRNTEIHEELVVPELSRSSDVSSSPVNILRSVLRFLASQLAWYLRAMVAVVSVLALLVLHARVEAQPTDRTGFTGKQLYDAACAACHGPDGRGQPIAVRGFETDPPDFTDCQSDDS